MTDKYKYNCRQNRSTTMFTAFSVMSETCVNNHCHVTAGESFISASIYKFNVSPCRLYLSMMTGSEGVSLRFPQLFLSQHRLSTVIT